MSAATKEKLHKLADRGVGFDMNPTLQADSMGSLWQQWADYLKRVDRAWRHRVRSIAESEDTDWRVLGGVIPGPIPVEWVQVGDTIQDHGVTGVVTRTFTRINQSGGVVHLSIDSGHVSFAKVARQDFVHVTAVGEPL